MIEGNGSALAAIVICIFLKRSFEEKCKDILDIRAVVEQFCY